MAELKRIPELEMSVDELNDIVQAKAERKMALYEELLQLDAEITTYTVIISIKAVNELNKTKGDESNGNQE